MSAPYRLLDPEQRDWSYLERRALSLWNSDEVPLYQIVRQLRVPERWARELVERAFKDGRTTRSVGPTAPKKKRLGALIRAVKQQPRP